MRMVLKIFYLVLIWGVVTAICLGASYVINGEDMQPGFGWAGLIFALWLSWRLLRWMFIRYKARSRAMHLANFEPAVVGESTSFWSKLATSWVKPGVDQRLHAVLRFLSSSRLARNQNPKYALPWFVVVGTPAADIEATLAAANVGKPSVDQSDFNSPDFETRWWLTNQAVLISTSTSLTSSAPQLDEWLRLLRLLRTQRPANPVNGFVVALSISELINRSADELAELGELYRKRIDEAMSLTGVKMPVYIQLTGAEQLPGMAVLIDLMSDAERDQFFGVLNRDGIGSDEFMGQFIDHVTETIQKRSLTYLLQHESAHSLIELPSTLRGYSSKLSAFVNGCFQVSAFQNTPDIRGICLSAQITTEDGYTKPAFVKVFLEQILAAENRLAGILPEAEQRQRQMRNGLFGGYLMVLALVLGLLGYSYVGHRTFVGDLREQYAGTLVERQDAFLNINIFYRLQTVINALDGRIWFPWITHNRFVADVKMNFVSRSDVALLVRLESDLKIKATEELLVGRDIKLMGQFVNTLIDQINWLEAYTSGTRGKELTALAPPYSLTFPTLPDFVDQEQVDRLNSVYRAHLDWSGDGELVTQDLEAKRELLEQILVEFPGQFSWMIEWANKVAYGDRVQLKNYWRGGATLVKKHEVPGAYTVGGKAAIDALLDSMEQISGIGFDDLGDRIALPEDAPAYLVELRLFREDYYSEYLKQWEDFLINFGDGAQVLANQDDWQGFVENLRNAKNPFFIVLTEANNQLIDFIGTEREPDWLYLIDYYNQVLALLGQTAPGGGADNKAATKTAIKLISKLGSGGKAIAKMAKTVQKTQKSLDSGGGAGPSPTEMQLAMADVSDMVLLYQQGLSDIVANSSKRLVSLAAMRENFLAPRNPGGGTTAYAQAWKAVSAIETQLGREKASTKAFWRIFKGSVVASQRYLMQEATCAVQEQWQNQYLANLDGVPLTSVPNLAYVEEGLLWAFHDAVLAPFVKKGNGVFSAKKLENASLALTPKLYQYLNNGSAYRFNNKPFYQVFIDAKPISVNINATLLPHESKLTLVCPEREYLLRNNNFPISQMMQWSDTCQSFELSIAVGRYVVKKQYPGALGFARFVQEFKDGTTRLPIAQFPEFEDRLAALGIRYFDLNFRFKQHMPMLNRLATSQLATPPIVADCWDLSTTTLAMEL